MKIVNLWKYIDLTILVESPLDTRLALPMKNDWHGQKLGKINIYYTL